MIKNLSTPEYLMLEYAPKFHTGDNEFQQFWKFKYNVNPEEVISSMLTNGILCEDGIAITLGHSDATTLKSISKKFDLKSTGKKTELISKLLEEIDYDTLNNYFPQRYYALTELGMSYKNTLEFFNALFAHRHPNYEVSADEVPLGMDIKDYIWSRLNMLSLHYYNHTQWGLYRNTRHNMGELLMIEEKYEQAFPFYIEVCVCDMSANTAFLAPGILNRLNELRKTIGYSDDDLLKNIAQFLECLPLAGKFESINNAAHFIAQKIIDFTTTK